MDDQHIKLHQSYKKAFTYKQDTPSPPGKQQSQELQILKQGKLFCALKNKDPDLLPCALAGAGHSWIYFKHPELIKHELPWFIDVETTTKESDNFKHFFCQVKAEKALLYVVSWNALLQVAMSIHK